MDGRRQAELEPVIHFIDAETTRWTRPSIRIAFSSSLEIHVVTIFTSAPYSSMCIVSDEETRSELEYVAYAVSLVLALSVSVQPVQNCRVWEVLGSNLWDDV